MDIKKRSPVERANIALTLIKGIWAEVMDRGLNEREEEENWDLLNSITELQVFVNRCNWKLNHLVFDDKEGDTE